MATRPNLDGVLPGENRENVRQSKVLVVGTGGIGCELLKNLVLTGFEDIEIIDLDTIDVSNLNRQFLFRREHVGRSKAQVAKESALRFNPDANIVSHHDSITGSNYGVDFFRRFTVVMNALDNLAARNHVNRMCLAADVPLIESGTAGYLGQVTVIKKGRTECYECRPKPRQKTYPGCTIRNTPSEPIHCIVWAKHLFNQLFGEEDPDEDVSPDTEDPELAGDAGENALQAEAKENAVGGIERVSTRVWAMETGYNAERLFNKMFRDDIRYLLSMANLWKKRRPPEPLEWGTLPETVSEEGTSQGGIRDQRIWSIVECAQHFEASVDILREKLQRQAEGGSLVWDKDDEAAMDFVTCAANIRAHIFGIPRKSRFDIKSMAGNIIPAIATTNAIIAGLIVMEGLKVIAGRIEECKQVYLNQHPNPMKRLLVPCVLDKPNPKCYVCSEKPEVTVILNTATTTVKTLEDKVLKGGLGMMAPDVEVDDGRGTILISSEEGETEENSPRCLSEFGINNGSRLNCDDFLQVYHLVVNIVDRSTLSKNNPNQKEEEEEEFEIVGDISKLQKQAKPEAVNEVNHSNGLEAAPGNEDEEDELMIVEEAEAETSAVSKRKHGGDDGVPPQKRARLDEGGDGEDIIVL